MTLLATKRNITVREAEMTAAVSLYFFLTSLKLFMTLKITDVRVNKNDTNGLMLWWRIILRLSQDLDGSRVAVLDPVGK